MGFNRIFVVVINFSLPFIETTSQQFSNYIKFVYQITFQYLTMNGRIDYFQKKKKKKN